MLRIAWPAAQCLPGLCRLEGHPSICKVHYPGLRSHPDHTIAAEQMTGYGGVVSFEVAGDLWDTARVIDSVRLPYIAPSLGGVETLIEQPTVISYWDQVRHSPHGPGLGRHALLFSLRSSHIDTCKATHVMHAYPPPQEGGISSVLSGDIDKSVCLHLLDSNHLDSHLPFCSHHSALLLCSMPNVWVFAIQGPEKRAEYGIVDNLVRLSCGVEHQEDIWEDLCQALDQLQPCR